MVGAMDVIAFDMLATDLTAIACIMLLLLREQPKRLRRQDALRRVAVMPRAPRVPRTRLALLSDAVCQRRYRLKWAQIRSLYKDLKPDLESSAAELTAVPGINKLLGCLRYLATGSFPLSLSELGGVPESTFCKVLDCFLKAMRDRFRQYIYYPTTPHGWVDLKVKFYEYGRFPNVLGAIDCTHFEIRAPSNKPVAFLNSGGFYSINVQMTCDANMRIMNVFVKFPGSVEDSEVLEDSWLYRNIEKGRFPNGWFLGDSGYPLKTWLMTPCRRVTGAAHKAYNKAHEKTRSVIEKTFRLLKTRFRCLDKSGGPLPCNTEKMTSMIIACSCLHNIAIQAGQLLEEDCNGGDVNHRDVPVTDSDVFEEVGIAVRDRIIREYFADVDSD